MSERLKPDLSDSLILSGKDVCNLPSTLLMSYCEKISAKLKGPNTISESSDKLYEAILDNRAVLAMDVFTNKLYGFAQVKPKPNSQDVWIFNSWTSFATGISRPIVWSAAVLVFEINPEAQLIAKVREGNTKAQKAITETGGAIIDYETSERHFNTDSLQPVHKKVFDVSLGRLLPTSPPTVKVVTSFDSDKKESQGSEYSQNEGLLRRIRRWILRN